MTVADSRSASIDNVVIRCLRSDQAAAPVFELVREELGLWVLELDSGTRGSWEAEINSIVDQLEIHRTLLAALSSDSSDYTLHICVASEETLSLRLPIRLCKLAADCGFEIEIYAGPLQDQQ